MYNDDVVIKIFSVEKLNNKNRTSHVELEYHIGRHNEILIIHLR